METLKEFKNILLGQQIKTYTQHENLIYKIINKERVKRWRLVLDKYNAEIIHIQGSKNTTDI